VLAFDAGGKPTVLTVVSNEDASLRADLASTSTGFGNQLVAIPKSAKEIVAGSTIVNAHLPPGFVLRYGNNATPGTTPMQTIIQAAIDSGEVVSLPDEVSLITAQLDVPSNTKIRGLGLFSEIRFGANIKGFVLDGVSNVELRDFLVNGVRATFTSSANDGISSPANGTGCENILIDNVDIVGVAGAGIIFLAQTGSHSSRIRIKNNFVFNTGAHGIICQDFVDETYISGRFWDAGCR